MLRSCPYWVLFLHFLHVDIPGDFEVSFFYAVVCGFDVYQAIWTPTVEEEMPWQQSESTIILKRHIRQWQLSALSAA